MAKQRPTARTQKPDVVPAPSPAAPEPAGETASRARFWTVGKSAFVAAASLGALLVGFLALPEQFVSFATNKGAALDHAREWLWESQSYEGSWTSDAEGWVGQSLITDGQPVLDTGEVQVSLASHSGGAFSGEIVTRALEENFAPWSILFLEGSAGFRGLDLVAWHIVQGKRQDVTWFRLERVDGDADRLRVIQDPRGARIFPPGEVVLWRTARQMAEGRPGKRFEEAMQRVIRDSGGVRDPGAVPAD